ncbi:RtcB family protein [Parachitinimonas caeni]|uniref:3'-phosphate/5'-hydroxy nucleic acid ligase n=1 Tax=Parachitinimonas caeni TaxID=3031301 RepID=A0ABT7E398_9NEIS|nr:RtcB family protein [Parachitinimonas caeni]MDK2126797.1 RtcB family protein [Parachitinimonas caeni]
MPVHLQINKGRVPIKLYTSDIEPEALQQLVNVANLSIVSGHIAAMPDVHAGIGATVGSVIPTTEAVIPAAVGVDIGCGMNAVQLSLRAEALPDNLAPLRSAIEAVVPVGFAQHAASKARSADHQQRCQLLSGGIAAIIERYPDIARMQRKFDETWRSQLGTLGGGNHFIELCLDEVGQVWIMLHSGSRGVGNAIGRYFIAAAQKDMRRHKIQLPHADLAYLKAGSCLFDDYVSAVTWAQEYAWMNRQTMMQLVLEAMRPLLPPFAVVGEAINCHHNYVTQETHFGQKQFITRKGAISAQLGELGIIPGSMGAKSFIVRGLGNRASYCSCSHGAGRRMSRMAARRQFNRADLQQQTTGVECRKDEGVIDEIPAAYKDIDRVMANQTDLVEVVHTLKQVVCIKG